MLSRQSSRKKPFIDPADLKPFELEAQLTNSASGNGLGSGEPINVLELGEQALWIEASDQLCAMNHHVVLAIKSIGLESDISLTCTARVTSIETESPRTARIGLSLVQYDKAAWSRLQSLMSTRQRKLDAALRQAKGY